MDSTLNDLFLGKPDSFWIGLYTMTALVGTLMLAITGFLVYKQLRTGVRTFQSDGIRKMQEMVDTFREDRVKIYTTFPIALAVSLTLNGSIQTSLLTNWAFTQLCQQVSAPSGYLRSLSPEITAQCLEYGINANGVESKILIRKNDTFQENKPQNMVSAFTSPNYGRIWDYDVVEAILAAIQDSPWHTPPSNSDYNSGIYASDRDMFVFLVSDENPVEVGNARLGRGFFCWNSETGAATFGLTTFLYNYVCDNHIVWGAEQVEELRIIHRNHALNRFYSDAIPLMNRFIENRSLDDTIKDTVARAMEHRIGDSQEETFKRLQPFQFTKNEIERAWNYGITEGEDVRTAWGIVQGLTAYARNMPHIDKRVSLERRAGALLN